MHFSLIKVQLVLILNIHRKELVMGNYDETQNERVKKFISSLLVAIVSIGIFIVIIKFI